MRKGTTALCRCVSLLLLLFTCLALHAQPKSSTKTIAGKVTDENNAGVSGATISIKGGTASTATKGDGTFSLVAPSTATTLVISFAGYLSQEIAVTGNDVGTISLRPDPKSLENVVVVGYGTRKKGDVTAAIASVSGEKLRSVPTTNVSQALQGRVTGLEVAANSFRPGEGSRIRVRGNRSLTASNDPLYVVDGFPVSYTINDINPNDIESIDVLKDASATAIYGVRGANGVIQITTKKGKAGKLTLDYSGSQSWDNIIRKVPVFNSVQLADVWRQAYYNDKQYNYAQAATSPNNYFPNAQADAKLFYESGNLNQWNFLKDAYSFRVFDPATKTYIANKRASTQAEKDLLRNLGLAVLDSLDIYDPSKIQTHDWSKDGLRTGNSMQHNLSVTGGSDKLRTSLSAGYYKQNGIEYGQDYTRYSISNSNEFRVNKNITFGTNFNYIYSVQNTSTSSYGNALGMLPFTAPYDSAGKYILYPNGDQQVVSAINDRNTVFDETKANRIFGNIYGELTLFKGLKYRTMFGLDSRNSRRGTFNGSQSSIKKGGLADAAQTITNNSSWVWDNIVTYNTTIKSDHTINATFLYEMQSLNRISELTLSAQNLIFEEQKWYSLQRNTLATVTGSGTYQATQYLSYMGRLEYGYKNRYLLTVSNRYDNSSVLAVGKTGAFFPAASVAWRVENEPFFNKQNFLTTAKVRLGIGTVGNASIPPYLTGGPVDFTNYNWTNGTAAIGAAPLTFKAPNLGWERTTTANAGIDYGLLRGRITGSIDVYATTTKDMLQQKSIPTANGVGYIYVNLGEIKNNGVEFSISSVNVNSRKGFTWSTDLVVSHNKEKIVDVDGSGYSNYQNLWILGQPLQVYYNYKKVGIFQYSDTAKGGILADYYWQKAGNRTSSTYRPGAIRIVDANGDTSLSPADKVVLGTHNPSWTGSITNTVSYKNFELNFMVYVRLGGLYRVPRPVLVSRYQSTEVNYWTPTNPSNDYQEPTKTSDIPPFWEALTYRSASYARVRNISLTYRIPAALLKKIHAGSLSLYVNAVNPFLFHSASAYDPETVPYRETFSNTNTGQTGPTSYSYRSIFVGAKLGF